MSEFSSTQACSRLMMEWLTLRLKGHGLSLFVIVDKVVMVYDLASGNMEFEITGVEFKIVCAEFEKARSRI